MTLESGFSVRLGSMLPITIVNWDKYMLPLFSIKKGKCLKLCAGISYGCQDCGHNALVLKIGIGWWSMKIGIEFGGA